MLSACGNSVKSDAKHDNLEPLLSVSCYVFRTNEEVRPRVLRLLNDIATKFDGKILVEPQEVYLKMAKPEYYLSYNDRQSAYGNLIESYWVDPESRKIDLMLKEILDSSDWNIEDCTEYRKSATDRFDFPD